MSTRSGRQMKLSCDSRLWVESIHDHRNKSSRCLPSPPSPLATHAPPPALRALPPAPAICPILSLYSDLYPSLHRPSGATLTETRHNMIIIKLSYNILLYLITAWQRSEVTSTTACLTIDVMRVVYWNAKNNQRSKCSLPLDRQYF